MECRSLLRSPSCISVRVLSTVLLASVFAACASRPAGEARGALTSSSARVVKTLPEGLTATAVGFAAPGTDGAEAQTTAFIAATVSALADLAQLAIGTDVEVTRLPGLGGRHLRTHFAGALAGDLHITADTWVSGEGVGDITETLRIPYTKLKTAWPLTLTVRNSVLVAPSVKILDPEEIRTAIERSGLVIASKAEPDGAVAVEVTVSVPVRITSEARARACPGAFTGIIVDVSETYLRFSFAPKIVAVGGRKVFVVGAAQVNYATSWPEAISIGDNPLVIRALGSAGDRDSDVVVSEDDARKLEECARDLEQARFVFVFGEPGREK